MPLFAFAFFHFFKRNQPLRHLLRQIRLLFWLMFGIMANMKMATQLPLNPILWLRVGQIVILTMIARYDNPILNIDCTMSLCQSDTHDFYYFFAQGDLLCFSRAADEEVPGCTGAGESGKDYCWDRTVYPELLVYRGNEDIWNPLLQRCEGEKDTLLYSVYLQFCFSERFSPSLTLNLNSQR